MATTITQAPNGRKTVVCDITGLGFTHMGSSLDAYTATLAAKAWQAAREARLDEQRAADQAIADAKGPKY
jgi:hypothetical protein